MKRVLVLYAGVAALLTGCGGSVSSSSTQPTSPQNPGISPISPGFVTLVAGSTQQFTASVTPGAGLTWEVNAMIGGDAQSGTISSSGLYTAPSVPPGQFVGIGAYVTGAPDASSQAAVKVVSGAPSLSGQYVFRSSGRKLNAPGAGMEVEVGRFTADGLGGVSNGTLDINAASGFQATVPFSGAYSVSAGGQGNLLITPAASSGLASQHFDMVVISTAHAQLIRNDVSETGSGSLDQQAGTGFANSALNGNYIVELDGLDGAGDPMSSIGLVTLDGAGNVSAALFDLNDSGTVTLGNAASGSYNVGSTGRGTMTVNGAAGSYELVFELVSSARMELISAASAPVWAGPANLQQGSGFSSAALNGPMVFLASGANSAGELVDAGFFEASNGNLSSAIGDENSAGTATKGYLFSGTYVINAGGHGTLTVVSAALGTYHYSLYMISGSEAALLRTDSSAVTSGMLELQPWPPQVGGMFDTGASAGFTVNGASGAGSVEKLGQFTQTFSVTPACVPCSVDYEAAGTEDDNSAGALSGNMTLAADFSTWPNGACPGSPNPMCAASPPGVLPGSMTLTINNSNRQFNWYFVSTSRIFLIGMDMDQTTHGVAEQQSAAN